MHDDVSVSKDEYLKRNTIRFCDKIKGTVDVVDRKIGKYTTKMKTKRWSMNTFTNALDTC